MGLFDKFEQKRKQKAIDNSIEEAKNLISEKDYYQARYILSILKDEYRQNEVVDLMKKTFPQEIKDLADRNEMAKETGYRLASFSLKYRFSLDIAANCTFICSFLSKEGKRTFCEISENEEYKAFASDFEKYWGAKVFCIIEHTEKVYLLAVEPDKSLWTIDKTMAYCVENRNINNAVYQEIPLTTENGIPVVDWRFTSEHMIEKDKYIKKVKLLFEAGLHNDVLETVEYMDSALNSDYRKEQMEEVYHMYAESDKILQESGKGRYANLKNKEKQEENSQNSINEISKEEKGLEKTSNNEQSQENYSKDIQREEQSLPKAFPEHIDGKNAEYWYNEAIRYYHGENVAKNLSTSLEYMENAANLGFDLAMYNCYVMYSQGQGTAVDDKKAYYWAKKAAENNNAKGMFCLSKCYYTGKGCEKNYPEGNKWLEKSAENGYEVGMSTLAYFYSRGTEHLEKSDEKSLYWYEKSAQAGNDESMMKCADAYAEGKICEQNDEKVIYWLNKAYQADNADAICRVGRMKLDEAKTYEDVKEILETFFIPSAKKGDKVALYYCAECFRLGSGIEKDEKKALELYEASAEKGFEHAQRFLIELYTQGGIAEPDEAKALYWREKLGEQDLETALELVDIYFKEEELNLDKIIYWLMKAIEFGDVNSASLLAELYRKVKNNEKAFKYSLIAAEGGHIQEMHNCSISYEKGEGTEKDISKALFWREEAAKAGSLIDQLLCVMTYYLGGNFEINHEKAFHWAETVIKRVDELETDLASTAYALLGEMYFFGIGTEKDYKKAYDYIEKAYTLSNESTGVNILYEICLYGLIDDNINVEKAFYWAEQSAKKGDGGEHLFKGALYIINNSDKVKCEKTQVIFWLEKAWEYQNVLALLFLIAVYKKGYLGDINDERGDLLNEKAIEVLKDFDLNSLPKKAVKTASKAIASAYYKQGEHKKAEFWREMYQKVETEE